MLPSLVKLRGEKRKLEDFIPNGLEEEKLLLELLLQRKEQREGPQSAQVLEEREEALLRKQNELDIEVQLRLVELGGDIDAKNDLFVHETVDIPFRFVQDGKTVLKTVTQVEAGTRFKVGIGQSTREYVDLFVVPSVQDFVNNERMTVMLVPWSFFENGKVRFV
jgi:hypothetical protein